MGRPTMAGSLIEKLDAAYARNPNPDQIATHLGNGGWIKCVEISENFFEENKRIPFVIGTMQNDGRFAIASGYPSGWVFTSCAGSHADFIDALKDTSWHGGYYMIRHDEYKPGDAPCLA